MPQCVYGDESKLRQIFINLIGNALKFTQRGHVIVAIAAGRSTTGLLHLRGDVADTGDGISPEELPRIGILISSCSICECPASTASR